MGCGAGKKKLDGACDRCHLECVFVRCDARLPTSADATGHQRRSQSSSQVLEQAIANTHCLHSWRTSAPKHIPAPSHRAIQRRQQHQQPANRSPRPRFTLARRRSRSRQSSWPHASAVSVLPGNCAGQKISPPLLTYPALGLSSHLAARRLLISPCTLPHRRHGPRTHNTVSSRKSQTARAP